MERFTQRENILLGCSPERSFEYPSSTPKTPLTNSDVDFHDVFGGPPRRSSIHEMRYSFGGSTGSEDTLLCRSSCSSLSEKPVFGEESVNRRRYASDDFFDDIFRGDESYSSPRRSDRDPFCSKPVSRVSSPARPLPPRAEPFGTSLPAQFSLPAKLTKAIDFSAFAFGNHSPNKYKDGTSDGLSCPYPPDASLSRFSSKVIQGQDELRYDVRPSRRESPLSHEYPLRIEESSYKTKSDETDMVGNLKEDSKRVEATNNSNHFHFSIYKWAGGGVPLLVTLQGTNRSKSKENDKIERDSMPGEVSTGDVHDTDSLFLKLGLSEHTESFRVEGDEEITRMAEGKENVAKMTKVSHSNVGASKTIKKHDGKRINSNEAEVNKASKQGSPINSGDNRRRSGVNGKVKDFVKIFNPETFSNPKINVETRRHSSRWKGTGIFGADKEASVDENAVQSEKQHSHVKTTIPESSDISSRQKDASSFSGSLPNGAKVTIENIDDLFQENFLIKELSHDLDNPPQTGKDSDAVQVSDAKIQQWSNGKKGNIRSLLSTLQYVLWPESGWKPVPLVDIIEGSAVKRAYQKALLCLHPDKLQQKGTASHQKYIAEKVFDVLQEAWDHFNSLGSL